MKFNVFKRFCLLLTALFFSVLIYAQTQYDYYDDSAVAGGADRALNGIIIMVLLVVGAIILLVVGNVFFNIYYWFNPKAKPEYKAAKYKEEKQKQHEKYVEQMRADAIPQPIDLGLSVKWASFNLGAYKASDVGGYFYWAENCLSTKGSPKFEKINVCAIGDIGGNEIYDAATKILGANWRLPTDEECGELIDTCKWEVKCIDNIEGRLVTGPNGNTIFIPYNEKDIITGKYDSGHYWTSTPHLIRNSNSSKDLRFGNNLQTPFVCTATANRCLFGIRPVFVDNVIKTSKEEKRNNTLADYSLLKTSKNNELEHHYIELFKEYEKQCYIKEEEKNPNSSPIFGGHCLNEEKINIDEYGVIYSKDGKRLLNGSDCNCEVYRIKEGTKFICHDAFKDSILSLMYRKKRVLKKIILPSSLLYIPTFAICDNCDVISNSPYYKIIDKLLIDNRKKSVLTCLDKFIQDVVIGEPIEIIEEWAFANCEVLQNVELPITLKRIGANAFRNDEMLKNINLPDSIEVIDEEAFFCCKSMRIDKLPQNITIIGNSAFGWCNMENITIPNSVDVIGHTPFPHNCTDIHSDSERYVIKNDLLIDTYEQILIQLVSPLKPKITIPKHISKIGNFAFSHSDIESISIPSDIKEIGKGIFWSCKKLESICFEGSLAFIPQNTFAYCHSLTSIKLPAGVKEIGANAFYECKCLNNVELNKELTILRKGVFNACNNLVSLDLPESLEIIGDEYKSSILNCPNFAELHYNAKNAIVTSFPTTLSNIIIGEDVEILPSSLIERNENIDVLTIPQNVRKISKRCVVHSNLTEIVILSKDIVLEEDWIIGCNNLKRIVLHADMYDCLLPHLPCGEKIKIKKIYQHNFLFFKW